MQSFHDVLLGIMLELRDAEKKHPHWPKNDLLRQVVIVAEEVGEAQRAALTIIETGESPEDIITPQMDRNMNSEMTQVAAMAIRFLMNREALP